MKRMGIFVFYDSQGCVDDYIEVLLHSLRDILQKIIIVVNGKVDNTGYRRLKKYATDLFVRENMGYDAGAYKDALMAYMSNEPWENWDEILLFNDTFYGPMHSWDNVFHVMDEKKVDFWGLSRHPKGGGKLSTGEEFPSHVQAYFLVCRQSLFLSIAWKEFWDNLKYPKTYSEAVESFEINFTKFFQEKGFQGSAFTDEMRIPVEYGKNPYLHYFRELIQNFDFPVMKRKVFCLTCLEETRKTIEYIKNNTDYDVNLLCTHVRRLCGNREIRPIEPFDSVQLEKFYNEHERVFIYGHGAYGKGLASYFRWRGWEYDGFIVSEEKGSKKGVLVFEHMEFDSKSGIILALGKQAFFEVYPMVKAKLDDDQLCCPPYTNSVKIV